MGSMIFSSYVAILGVLMLIDLSFVNSDPPTFDSIYQMGDSLSDTGNSLRRPVIGPTLPATRLPYGITIGAPTGRWSDGLITIDFIAIRFGLPLLNPYLNRNACFVNGVNFAVAASTALDFPFFVQKGIVIPPIAVPLPGQINWFTQYLSSICSSPTECLNRSVVFLGPIGINDIFFPLQQGRSIQEIRTYVPSITEAIVNGTQDVIRLGARRIVVPGNFPIGCFPFGLTLISNNNAPNSQELDQFGCAKRINELIIYQNNYLQNALNSLRVQYPNVTIVYADNYGAFTLVLALAPTLGFDAGNLFRACCGSGGPYNYDGTIYNCGKSGSTVCPNPSRYISWDGLHLTQEAYRRISEVIFYTILPQLY